MADIFDEPIYPVFWDADATALAGIGLVSTKWAFLEAVVEDCIAGFMGTNTDYVYVLTANINISTRLPAVLALALMRLSEADYATFAAIIGEIKQLVPFRNKIIHGLWAETNIGLSQVIAIKSAGRLKQQQEYQDAIYLRWLANEIVQITQRLMRFAQDFGLIKPFSGKPSGSKPGLGEPTLA